MAGDLEEDYAEFFLQGSHRLKKYLNLEGFLEKSLKIKSALKSTGNHSKALKSIKLLCLYLVQHAPNIGTAILY